MKDGVVSQIWMVVMGDYEDYRVLAVCESKRLAEEVVQSIPTNEYGDATKVECVPYFVGRTMPKDIEITTVSQALWDNGKRSKEFIRKLTQPALFTNMEDNVPVRAYWIRAGANSSTGGMLYAIGTDYDKVIKVFAEMEYKLSIFGKMRKDQYINLLDSPR